MTEARWRVRLSERADEDFRSILAWTAGFFGAGQATAYRELLVRAIGTLAAGPLAHGSVARDDIQRGMRTLHVARLGRRGRHIVVYRVGDERTLEVIRILHDAMELRRHLPPLGDGD